MFSLFDKYMEDEKNVKFVFDHFRNIGIIGLIWSVAFWKRTNPREGWLEYLDVSEGFLLFMVGMYLMAWNMNIVIKKVKKNGFPFHLRAVLLVTYALVATGLVGSFATNNKDKDIIQTEITKSHHKKCVPICEETIKK